MSSPQATGEKIVVGCPLCNIPFQEAVETNIKHDCPVCEGTFLVRDFTKKSN